MSFGVAISAGLKQSVLFKPGSDLLVAPIITPCAIQSATTACTNFSCAGVLSCLSETNSAPQNRPAPRTSPITSCFSLKFRKFSLNRSPIANVFSRRFSSSMIFIFSIAAAGPAVHPPNVEISLK